MLLLPSSPAPMRAIREDVLNARMRRNVEVVPFILERVVKKNADDPKPATTRLVVGAR